MPTQSDQDSPSNNSAPLAVSSRPASAITKRVRGGNQSTGTPGMEILGIASDTAGMDGDGLAPIRCIAIYYNGTLHQYRNFCGRCGHALGGIYGTMGSPRFCACCGARLRKYRFAQGVIEWHGSWGRDAFRDETTNWQYYGIGDHGRDKCDAD